MASETPTDIPVNADEINENDPDKDVDEQGEDEEGKTVEDLTEDAEALKKELDKIIVHPPTIQEYVYFT